MKRHGTKLKGDTNDQEGQTEPQWQTVHFRVCRESGSDLSELARMPRVSMSRISSAARLAARGEELSCQQGFRVSEGALMARNDFHHGLLD